MNPPTTYIESIDRCNRLFSTRTCHPQVSVIRLPQGIARPAVLRLGFYGVWLHPGGEDCPPCFGRQTCDFRDGTLTALAPGQAVEPELWRGGCGSTSRLLCFDPALFDPLAPGCGSPRYSFFGYATDESLHLSHRERTLLERELTGLEEELDWGVDACSRSILSERIRLVLDYVTRFYRRQFILRHDANEALLRRTDADLLAFFRSGRAARMPLPAAADFGGRFGCSAAYFDDLLMCETGKTTQSYVLAKRLSVAEELLSCGAYRPEEVALRLGFPTDAAFCRLFRRLGIRNSGTYSSTPAPGSGVSS